MSSPTAPTPSSMPIADEIAKLRNADVLLFSGPIVRSTDEQFIDLVRARRRRENVLLVLATLGGDANVAYRVGRCLQRSYKQFAVLIGGQCKSAGTLLVLGAHDIIMSDIAQLGPLDVQVRKPDEYEITSGLTPIQALIALESRAREAFRDGFIDLKIGMEMTTRTAASIASEMVTGLYAGVFAQVDPMRVAEMERALAVARRYGSRLADGVKNTKSSSTVEAMLARLVAGYPSHEYVIDREEAREIFERVLEPSAQEASLLTELQPITRVPLSQARPAILYLSGEALDGTEQPDAHDGVHEQGAGDDGAGGGDGAGTPPHPRARVRTRAS